MGLTNDLISQFAKITKDTKESSKESTVFGTAVKYNDSMYVRIDGSDLLTPAITTADVNPGERVIVMIKNHSATITGNVTSPSANGTDVKDAIVKADNSTNKITEFEILIADKVSTSAFDAQVGRIDTLYSDNVTIKQNLAANEASIKDLTAEHVTINQRLTANEASIENLETTKLDADVAVITYATIKDLTATNADIYNLRSTYADFEVAMTNRLTAIDATIDSLDTTYATITDLNTERARIDVLEAGSLSANSALIKQLQADIADIDTLIFGSASGDTIQASFANAVIAQLGNAQIKSAMIESVSADKITAGDIITNNVRVMSDDGKLLISDETIQIRDENRVRVQIGKDLTNDYSINVWDVDGNLMFSKGGITDKAIKSSIIRDDMVSDTANISAHKLDIGSLFEAINGSTSTIKSSRIYLDDKKQALDVAFNTVVTDIDNLTNTVSSQGTQLSVIQGQISSKVWQQDIDAVADDVNALSTQYSALDQTVDTMSATVSSHTTQIESKADKSLVKTVQDKVTEVEASLDGFKTTVSDTYATKGEMAGVTERVNTNKTAIEQNTSEIALRAKKTDVDNLKTRVETAEANISVNTDSISGLVTRTTENEQSISELKQTSNSLTSRISTAETGIDNARTAAENAQSDIDDLEIGGRNFARNTSEPVSHTFTTATGTESYDDCKRYYSHGIVLEAGQAYTLSYNYEFDWGSVAKPTDITQIGASIGSDNGSGNPGAYTEDTFAAIADYWTYGSGKYDSGRFVYSFINNKTIDLYFAFHMLMTYSSAGVDLTGVTLTISNFKVEKGNRATDWTPAPEDMATSDELDSIQSSAELTDGRLTTAESLLAQLSDCISMLVIDSNGESLMTQTDEGWTFSTSKIQSAVDSASQSLNELENAIGDVNSTIDTIQQALSDLGVLNDYVKIGSYESEPCIELGEIDSEFKLIITNTRIMFTEGSGVPAYFNNQSMFISRAVIQEELGQGEFIWKARSNGNLGLIWKGGSS